MILEEYDYFNELTEEQQAELIQGVQRFKDKAKWITVECLLPNIDMLEGIRSFKGVVGVLADENIDLGIKTILFMENSEEERNRVIRVKLFDNEPSINSSLYS